ncbi:hypothetical protein [Archangium primigenium]|uniref:hypothetical protein n=1 Tax=[Archangium] primigenium TaxID=2792470 RepID=UPI00195C4CCB|nr:hypothetical protein [Archangium primigenium]MBM7113226.1 hypothetical protein [Archangium primigenium]
MEDMTHVATGTLVTVLSSEGGKKWEGNPEEVVKVTLDKQSINYAFRSRLEPLGTQALLSDEAAGAILFAKAPKARRGWCARFTRRLVPSNSSRMLVYSASVDPDCAGYVAWVARSGKKARVLAATRRGAIQTLTVHEFASAPPVLEITDSLQGDARLNGVRKTFIRLDNPLFQELLAVDIRRDELEATTKRSSLAEVEVTPSDQGLDIAVRRTRLQVDMNTGAESNIERDTQHYQYLGGKLLERKPTREE